MNPPGRGRMVNRVLVIKLGALGDMVLAMGPFAAIRAAHADARITLLTTAPFAELMRSSPYFDEVWLDDRPSPWRPGGWLDLRRRLRGGRFDFVYDLQTSDRSGWYYRLMGPGRRPGWSGIARGCSHPHDNPARDHMHTIERQDEQLARAGVAAVPAADLSWIEGDGSTFGLAGRYVLLIPGGAADTNLLPGNPGDSGRLGADGKLIDPVVMRAPVVWLASDHSDGVTGQRFIGKDWDADLAPDRAAANAAGPAGFAPRPKD